MQPHYVRDYEQHVARLIAAYQPDQAMSLAVGGHYDTLGALEADILMGLGLKDGNAIFDLGCGSGRLSSELSRRYASLVYTGTDVVEQLLAYARTRAPGYRFIRHTDLSLPVASASLDFFVAFSVFTHLFHEESYLYLEDAKRALKPGGTIAFSFLEAAKHWSLFESALAGKRSKSAGPLTMFIERPMIDTWAERLSMSVTYDPLPSLGQSVAVLRAR